MISIEAMAARFAQVLYREAQLLDEGRFESWLEMHSPDIEYVAHIQSDVVDEEAERNTSHRLSYLAENVQTLRLRVLKIRTGLQQTEIPASRTVRLISNVRVQTTELAQTYDVHSAFLLYRNHRQRDVEILAGHRADVWVEKDDRFLLLKRHIRFAANVLPTKSLSLFY